MATRILQPTAATPAGGSTASPLWPLALGAVGVVYGDIGTSLLYAFREAAQAAGGDRIGRGEVLGVVSLLV